MTTVVRASISVLMLAGFYLVALLQLIAAVALVVWLSDVASGAVALKLAWPLFAAILGGAGVAIWRALRARPQPPEGLSVSPDEAPALWAMVRDLAAAVNTRVPDEIRLIPEVNASVTEHTRLLGLIGGRRYLYIGLPLLQVFTVDQLRATLAHELGHYSKKHTRLAAIAYRGRLTIAHTLSRIGQYNVVGWVFKWYGTLYLLVDNAVTRRQEYEADAAAVRLAGRDAMTSVLRELPVLDAAMGFFFTRYVEPGWEAGYAPADLFGGFPALLAARESELTALRDHAPDAQGSKWDTHPPTAARIAAISALPDTERPRDVRPAAVMLPDISDAGHRLQELTLHVGDRTVLPWEQFTNAMVAAALQREADRIFRVISRETGVAHPTLETVFRLISEGRLVQMAQPFFPTATRREVAGRFAEVLETLTRLAAVRSGRAYWQHSWSEPARFRTVDDSPLPLEEIAKLAVSPDGLDEARRRLAESGIDPATAAVLATSEDASGAEIVAGVANVNVTRGGEHSTDTTEYDLLVLTKGLLFVADPGRASKGKARLEQLIRSAPVAELAQRHWFVPYEEIAGTDVADGTLVRATVTLHDGRVLTLKERMASEYLSRKSPEVLADVLRRLNQR